MVDLSVRRNGGGTLGAGGHAERQEMAHLTCLQCAIQLVNTHPAG